MSTSQPPAPAGATDQSWPRRVYEYLLQLSRRIDQPQAVKLRAKTAQDRPVVDGIVLFDPVENTAVISVGGQWRKITWT